MIGRLLVSLLFKLRPIKFKRWIELEDEKFKIVKAKAESRDEFPKLITHFLSIAFPISPAYFDKLYWADTLDLFSRVASITVFPKYLPLVSAARDQKQPDKKPWEYEGRTWFFYSSLIAGAFGWNLEYIAQLDVFEALALVQEILLDDQFAKEFQWGMSEASVIFDTKTQTSKPNPLPRPYWMISTNPADPLPIKRIRIPSHMLPVGVVSYDAVTDDYKPKEITPKQANA